MGEKKKFHRRSIRIKDYDYAKDGMYFITICTQRREKILSTIGECDDEDGYHGVVAGAPVGTENNCRGTAHRAQDDVRLSAIGKILKEEIERTHQIRKNVKINEYIIMPNHVHMIISIYSKGTVRRAPTMEEYKNPIPESIPTIIRYIKGAVTRRARKQCNYYKKLWQRNYYEHIIRNEREYWKVCEYIELNPVKWKFDEYYRK